MKKLLILFLILCSINANSQVILNKEKKHLKRHVLLYTFVLSYPIGFALIARKLNK